MQSAAKDSEFTGQVRRGLLVGELDTGHARAGAWGYTSSPGGVSGAKHPESEAYPSSR